MLPTFVGVAVNVHHIVVKNDFTLEGNNVGTLMSFMHHTWTLIIAHSKVSVSPRLNGRHFSHSLDTLKCLIMLSTK